MHVVQSYHDWSLISFGTLLYCNPAAFTSRSIRISLPNISSLCPIPYAGSLSILLDTPAHTQTHLTTVHYSQLWYIYIYT